MVLMLMIMGVKWPVALYMFLLLFIVFLDPPPLPPTPLSLPSWILALALSIRLPSIRALQPAYCIYMNITLGSSVPP